MSQYELIIVLALMGSVGVLVSRIMHVRHEKEMERLQDKIDSLSHLEKTEAVALENERKTTRRLRKTLQMRKEFLHWVARELKEGRGSQRSNVIADKIYDLSYYEELTEKQTKENVPLNIMCNELVAEYRKKAMQGVDIVYKSNFHDYFAVRTNRQCLEKILRNLLDNAVNHTVSGFITLDVLEEPGRLNITVTDTGSGIPQERRKKVFSLLHRVSNLKQRVGTGLNLCRTLVEYLGGTIYIDPHYKLGTRVVFDIAI